MNPFFTCEDILYLLSLFFSSHLSSFLIFFSAAVEQQRTRSDEHVKKLKEMLVKSKKELAEANKQVRCGRCLDRDVKELCVVDQRKGGPVFQHTED